ncbi:hypothetical protein RRG08_014961 [Elysia crispata]|uniref:Uncharacterized protein n=1 Tax=Elysia crispata TaxID=231223 RepID=A0AAE1DW22_9GAST|nr:hypothetical protein RRG08_014961 [Elysia crispata]
MYMEDPARRVSSEFQTYLPVRVIASFVKSCLPCKSSFILFGKRGDYISTNQLHGFLSFHSVLILATEVWGLG